MSQSQRWALCCEPLIGTFCEAQRHSAQHDSLVSLWIQALPDGRIQVDAIAPRLDYRVLFRHHYTDETAARQAFRMHHKTLFGHDWEH